MVVFSGFGKCLWVAEALFQSHVNELYVFSRSNYVGLRTVSVASNQRIFMA
jgi:hypothetical protein